MVLSVWSFDMLAVKSGVLSGKLVAAAALALFLAGCASSNPTDPSQLGGGTLPGQGDQFGAGGEGSGVARPGSQKDFAVNVGDTVRFETDSAEITPTASAILDKQAQWLARYATYAVTVEGHADERGTREYNFALGARRAEAAKNYLVARGVDPGRLSTNSLGKERPVSVCDDISCWSQNRRAVTLLGGGGT
jgi:peptidoglycan-associated lipoprotein